MWHHRSRLPHVLPPSAYGSPEHHARERAGIFASAWHVVATDGALAKPGSFVSCAVLDDRVLVENRGGEIHACVDRARPGRDAARTPGDRGRPLPVVAHGALVFVRLSDDGPTLRESYGEATLETLSRCLPRGARLAADITLSHPCNWKIPLENVLETYHIPSLHDNVLARHPEVFRVFSARRDGASAAHDLEALHTAYHATFGGESRVYQTFLRWADPGASVAYLHHHAFPNLIVARTGIVSYLQTVEPTSPTTCLNRIRLFLDVHAHGSRRFRGALSPLLDRAAQSVLTAVIAEDAAVYADVQRGLRASSQRGVLGASEERVHAFQQHVLSRVTGA